MTYILNLEAIKEQFLTIRERTEEICFPLEIEDYVVQPNMDVSPPKWHLAHTTWFFEQFVLINYVIGYKEFHPDFSFLFNSYYNNLGERTLRQNRGFMTRPTVLQVYEYRSYVTSEIVNLLSGEVSQEILKLIEIGINHEQQHQELLAYDIKYILGNQAIFPALGTYFNLKPESQDHDWIIVKGGMKQVGADEGSFSFDNELPRHEVYLENYEISNKLVTNGEFIAFMESGGYENFNLWHAEGWDFINKNGIKSPLYWHFLEGEWYQYTFEGLQPLKREEPVRHVSLYEAFAFAEFKKMRLPTEFEWEVAADSFEHGQLWEWTQSAYQPYPGFSKAPGALGEYNGKFMMNQNVLRGGSVATPAGHGRKSYRNFFHASSRWIFSGIRLAK